MFNIFRSKNKNNDINTDEVTPQKNQIEQPELSSENNHNIDTVEATSDSNKKTPPKLKINQLKQEKNNDLLLYLKQQLGIDVKDDIEVTGELSATHNDVNDSYHCRIYNVKAKAGEQIEYPISDLDKKDSIRENGIYVPYAFNKALKEDVNAGASVLVKCKLELSSASEREKHNNPLLLNVDPKSVQKLHEINKEDVIKDDNGNVLVEESVINYYSTLKKEEIQKVITEELETLENTKANLVKLGDEYNSKEKNIQNQEVKLKKLQTEVGINQETKVHLQDEVAHIKIELDHLKDIQMKKLDKLRNFIKDKADTLLDLEFIDQEEYDNLLMRQDNKESNEKFVDFHNDLLEDKQSLISHIQAYLFEKNIVYPRYIIEDFYALVQTNDLIILAGESGSGKTNLVKSFVDAIGGKSFIIPVKPNWTSSEDLLGYYNPLEKKYLTTPFLEALLEAKDNPTVPYFICLDEMNLARIEYYFADFLSLLEERGELPEIKLYSDDESAHILSEFKNVMKTIEVVKEKYKKKNIVNFIELLQDEEINRELTRIFGFSDKDSLIKYHTDLRRMLNGILTTPSSIVFPKNVRIIGTINIDETTHYLSPKILDRAHIMKFDSPLLQDWTKIAEEIEDVKNKELRVQLTIENLGEREAYPKYDREDEFCKIITEFTKEYFSPLGIEVGLRTIRQGLNYKEIFEGQGSDKDLVLNNFILHKILPKMTFDGNKQVNEDKKSDLLQRFTINLKEHIDRALVKEKSIDVIHELEQVIKVSESNDGIVNYWA